MKNFKLLIFVALAIFVTSCATSHSVKKNPDTEIAGYTLKNKKELMHQKVLHSKNKTVIATP